MSQKEFKKGFGRELLGTINYIQHPEQRLNGIFENAKELVERHPKFAIGAAIIGGLALTEVYEHEYEKRTGEKLSGGPVGAIRDILNRFENDPEGIKGEAHKTVDWLGNYIRGHRALSLSVALAGPIVLEHIARRLEPKTPQPTSTRRVR